MTNRSAANCFALVVHPADDTVVAVTEECVAVYPSIGAWNGASDEDAEVIAQGGLSRATIVAAVIEAFSANRP